MLYQHQLQQDGTNTVAAANERVISEQAMFVMQALIVGVMVSPSPALAPGVAAVLSPFLLLVLAGAASRYSLRRRGRVGARAQVMVMPHVAAGIALAVSSFVDGAGNDYQRAIARLIAVVAVYNIALFIAKFPERRAEIYRAIVYGAAAAAAIAVLSAVFRLRLLGSDLLPNRSFVLPIPLPKTTGLPRSFGEAGVIYAAGIVFSRYIPRRAHRWTLLAVTIAGLLIGQSRNILAVFAAVLAIKAVARVSRSQAAAVVFGFVALLSPFVASIFIEQSAFAGDLVGDGIYARNVQARLSLAAEVRDFLTNDSLSAFGTTHEAWRETRAAAPHNHFVSLFIMDGLPGIAFLLAVYVRSLVVPAVGGLKLRSPEYQWLLASMVALSFYEGVYSASVTICLGLYWGSVVRTSP